MKMSNCRKILLILWKNWLFRRRHYFVTALELILPTLLVGLLFVLKNQSGTVFEVTFIDEFHIPDPENFMPNAEENFNQYDPINRKSENISLFFLYAPQNEITDNLMKYFPYYLEKKYKNRVKLEGVEDESTVERKAFQGDLESKNQVVGAIIFIDPIKSGKLSQNLYYRVRMSTNYIFWHTDLLTSPINIPGPNGLSTYLIQRMFLVSQHLIAIRYVEILSQQENLLSNITITLQEFPYPPYYYDRGFSKSMSIILPLFITLSYLFTAPTIIKRIVREKETGIRELMKMMGLPNWIQWFGWFVSNFIMMAISAIIIVVFLCVGSSESPGVLNYSAPELVYIIMLLYIASAICFCFFITSFFSKPSIATGVGVIIWLISFCVPYYSVIKKYHRLSFCSKMSLGLIPNMAMSWAVKIMTGLEGKKAGIQWNNLNEPSVIGDDLTMIHVIIMFIIDIILYSVLTWYFDNVYPGTFGVPKSWYFLFTKSYWSNAKSKVVVESKKNGDNENIEKDPVGLEPIISIQNLTMTYGSAKKLAVDNLNLNIYEGQITALLGHNGAGKTTTMSILTGMLAPSIGTAIINGQDIRTKMDEARKDLGLCPQHNMLFDKLTVREHLIFFGRLKMSNRKELEDDVKIMMKKLQLYEKKNVVAMNLAGGMKRKLNLGIALVGGSKIVMLDEPTSGIDPEARRAIWDLLQEYRTGRCILLSTHFMEEADVLGDRIAIMARGQIECCGTPLFLKKRYGAGYHLTLNISNIADLDEISREIRKFVAMSYLKNKSKGELIFVLPPKESPNFSRLFEELENNSDVLGINNFGLSVTTLEEVFLKVGETVGNDKNLGKSKDSAIIINPQNINFNEIKRNTGISLWFQQIHGLFLKRFYYTFRRPILILTQIAVPTIIIFFFLLQINSLDNSSFSAEPPLLMSFAKYGSTVAFVRTISTEQEIITLSDAYISSFPSRTRVEKVQDSMEYLKDVGVNNFMKYRNELITGADFSIVNTSQKLINIWFNNIYYHSLPLGLNLVHNAIAKSYVKDEKCSISVENAPLPAFNHYYFSPGKRAHFFKPIVVGLLVPIGLSILSSSFVIFPIHERASKCKHLQFMTGICGFTFWLPSFLWDFFINFISSFFIIITFATTDKTNTFVGQDKLGITFLILMLYGWSSIPFTYFISFIFRVPASGFNFITVVNLISGIILSLWIYLTELFSEYETENPFSWFCYLFPNFSVTIALMKFVFLTSKNNACKELDPKLLQNICNQPKSNLNIRLLQCCPPEICREKCFKEIPYTQWELPGLGKDLTMLAVDGLIFFILIFLAEKGVFKDIADVMKSCVLVCKRKNKIDEKIENQLDDDVIAETNRVRMSTLSNKSEDVFLVEDLAKRFWNLRAVDKLNFVVEKGKCFGLLGINGAGKTTTFQMLTGDLLPTSGNARVEDFELSHQRSKYIRRISYCPQFDALIDHLTGREMLTVFAHLCGIDKSQLNQIVEAFLTKFDLTQHANKITLNYSGGNKRKLRAAMAFIGHTPVVFLDEPTTGVDPTAKRKIWTNIRDANNSGTSIVLTSHSMEECEFLCSRVTIMVNGQFQCIGGIQHLKNKFSQGFTILAKMKRNMEGQEQASKQIELQKFIEAQFPSAQLKDVHQGLIHYHVTDVSTKWNYLFATLEEVKTRFDLEDYSVSQATLEQIFLSFARKQRSVTS